MKVYVDQDGVLADFSSAYKDLTGREADKRNPIDWSVISAEFYGSLPLLPDAHKLINGINELGFSPVILTGIPRSVVGVDKAKVTWVERHFQDLTVITTFSRLKAEYCQPGDVLIDDWPKYKDRWEAAGGHWITHKSASKSLYELLGYVYSYYSPSVDY